MKPIDIHTHTSRLIGAHMSGDVAAVRRLLDRAGIGVAVISSIAALQGPVLEGNGELLAAIAADDRFFQFLALDPIRMGESMAALERWGSDPRVVGVKLHPRIGGYELNGRVARRLVEQVIARGLPLHVHTVGTQVPNVGWAGRYSTVWMIAEMAARFPAGTFIAAHLGVSERVDSGIDAVSQNTAGNLYLDTAALEVAHAGLLERVVAEIGADRLLFGTDAPLHDPAIHRYVLKTSEITGAQRALISGENALRVLPRLGAAVAVIAERHRRDSDHPTLADRPSRRRSPR